MGNFKMLYGKNSISTTQNQLNAMLTAFLLTVLFLVSFLYVLKLSGQSVSDG